MSTHIHSLAKAPYRGLQVVRPTSVLRDKQVFILETNRALLQFLAGTLGEECQMQAFNEPDAFLKALELASQVDLVIYAWTSTERSLAPLQHLQRRYPAVPVLLLCCFPETLHPAALSGPGRVSLLLKPFTVTEARQAVLELFQKPVAAPIDTSARESVLDSTHSFVRASEAMHEVERQASLVARSDIPVLILGESGTGKEILAIFLHSVSKRKHRTFLKINCAAMPAELLESELFGYEQGAFTGATRAKPGKFEVCDGGTIFLDEIGEMPMPLQAKLLQVLQDGTFSRLGSRATMRADVRVISATNIPMKKAIAEGQFREDLYYRLNGISIKLPPLRERKEEIPAMIRHFMQKGAARFGMEPLPVSAELHRAMLEYSWPGNLRELENLVNRLLVLRSEAAVISELVPADASTTSGVSEDATRQANNRVVSTDQLNAAAIVSALEENRWNRRATAEALQISYKALLYKIKQYDLTSKTA